MKSEILAHRAGIHCSAFIKSVLGHTVGSQYLISNNKPAWAWNNNQHLHEYLLTQ